MTGVKQLETIVRNHGLNEFKWIDPKTIVVAQWVRIKCEYGCQYYGRIASCPPNTPTVEECRRFFGDYRSGMVFHIQKVMADTQKRRAWGRKVNASLSKVRNDALLREIADKTSGDYFVGVAAAAGRGGTGRAALVNLIKPQDQETIIPGTPDRSFEQQLMGWLLGLIAGALCLEWLLRRLSRLA